MYWIRFQRKKWLLVGEVDNGAITTEGWYQNGIASYAHVYPNGIIKRFNEPIGVREDIEVLGPADEVKVTDIPAALGNMLTHPS